ncbi:hypothetical protein [Clostridium cellulovorans]|uniref:Uncharacterized protein n=1 Tax=Clostridium cellulovorans (strain ATCC 35296 / DSM 3052 / OCM 3 / 743B) TaxID=573061 RepID=D9SRQ9_CLOC7|nr:hypothetical protein [Clostridium cellulovorans]ADL50426.1 hypothetical protein Clocel_0655 [Clostridium cellulovorans 743B]
MKNAVTLLCFSIAISIFCTVWGLLETFHGPATVSNAIITLGYIFCWILMLVYGAKGSTRGFKMYFCIFWIITFGATLVNVYLNATDASIGWFLPFEILLIGPWYGLEFFGIKGYLAFFRIIAVISLIMTASGAMLIKPQLGKQSSNPIS